MIDWSFIPPKALLFIFLVIDFLGSFVLSNTKVFKIPMLKTFIFQHLQGEICIVIHNSSFSIITQVGKAAYQQIWLWKKARRCDVVSGVIVEILENLFAFQWLLSCLFPNTTLIKSNVAPLD